MVSCMHAHSILLPLYKFYVHIRFHALSEHDPMVLQCRVNIQHLGQKPSALTLESSGTAAEQTREQSCLAQGDFDGPMETMGHLSCAAISTSLGSLLSPHMPRSPNPRQILESPNMSEGNCRLLASIQEGGITYAPAFRCPFSFLPCPCHL